MWPAPACHRLLSRLRPLTLTPLSLRSTTTAEPTTANHCVSCSHNFSFLGGLLHVDMFAHNNGGIAYRDRNQLSETVVDHKREPELQLL
jgi:hypothetical protein